MLKNAYFGEKNVKISSVVGGSTPEPPFASGDWGLCPQIPALLLSPAITSFYGSILSHNAFYSLLKEEKITTAYVLLLLLSHFFSYFSL